MTKEQSKAYHRAYYLKHRERHAQQSKAWRLANAERKRLNDKAYRQSHRSKIAEGQKRWGKANPDKRRASSKRYRVRHPERMAAFRAAWEARNKDYRKATIRAWAKRNVHRTIPVQQSQGVKPVFAIGLAERLRLLADELDGGINGKSRVHQPSLSGTIRAALVIPDGALDGPVK